MINVSKLSEDLLLNVKVEGDYSSVVSELDKLEFNYLVHSLDNDDIKKAFWINIYNAFFLIHRKYDRIDKDQIYKSRLIKIAGESFSLDEIEHGILRRCKLKFALGLLTNYFFRKVVKRMVVKRVDFRIHFALNCGAKSCPPIAFYSPIKLDSQLNASTVSFLEGDVIIDDSKKVLKISQLFKWYWFDFGGKKGIYNIITSFLLRPVKGYEIRFNQYSWVEDLSNFR